MPLPPNKKKLKEREECEMLEKVLPTIQGQVLKRTGVSGSNPEQAWFRLIPLAVNNIAKENSRSVWVPVRHSKAWGWAEHPSIVNLVGVLQLGVSDCNPGLYTSEAVLNPLKTKRRPLYLKTQFVPRSKHFSSRL